MTGYLLDSHVLIWLLEDSPRLGSAISSALHASQAVYVSAASLWELAIKAATGKLQLHRDFAADVDRAGLLPLPVTIAHALAVRDAEPLPHRDPFDLMLLTQAGLQDLVLVTADRAILNLSRPGVVDARL